jgi:Zn2+/Cd2+-exporting ATPase
VSRWSADPCPFDEFFQSGLEEVGSPFLTEQSRTWARNLPLKASLMGAGLLCVAFAMSFVHPLRPVGWLCLALVYLLVGTPKLIDAIDDLLNLELNIEVLMTLAAFLSVLIGSAMEGGLLLVLFAVSGSLEELVAAKAKGAVRGLVELTPSTVTVIGDGGEVRKSPVREIAAGTQILIKAGEVVPLDGKVTAGASSVSLTCLTGESLPVPKMIGSEVPAGATNLEGSLTLEVLRTSSDSTVARIIQLITEAQAARPRFQRWLDRAGKGYATGIIFLSFLLALILPWTTPLAYLGEGGSIYRALAFLIAASPCALIIALPVAYLSALSACARSGALLKGGITLDALASCKAIAFDKTGTLTTGELSFLGIEALGKTDGMGAEEALMAAIALERHVVHPIASSLLRHHTGPLPAVQDLRAIPAYGVEGRVELGGAQIETFVGRIGYLTERLEPAQLVSYQDRANQLEGQGLHLSALLVGGSLFLLKFKDIPRQGTSGVLSALRSKLRLRLLMLTGDHECNAREVAGELGIVEYYANLGPHDKLKHVSELASRQGLAMVGDGINDAPALARATVGISMGKIGSHAAIEASDVVLLQDNLTLLPCLWQKARRTMAIVKQNVLLALVAIVGASIAALCGWLPLWAAVTLHEGGTVIVGLNSLRLLRPLVRQSGANCAGQV